MEFNIEVSPITNVKKRVCCNCGNNTRIKDCTGFVRKNVCEYDGHRIEYAECLESWCRHWCRDKKDSKTE